MVSTNRQVPRATIHKQILDAATEAPDASFEELADEISGASVDLVERVFDEYGDPAETEPEPTAEATAEPSQSNAPDMSDPESLATPTDLTEEQRVVLRAIRNLPNATQSELAEHIGVSASTVNRRLHKVEGFQWDRRIEIVEKLLGSAPSTEAASVASDGGANGREPTTEMRLDSTNSSGPDQNRRDEPVETDASNPDAETPSQGGYGQEEDAALHQRLERLETRMEALTATSEPTVPFDDSGLAAKVIRACIASDAITEEEEHTIIETMLTSAEQD